MTQARQASITTDTLNATESSLDFVLMRHRAVAFIIDDTRMDIVLKSSVDPEDLFQARAEELARDLAYYRFNVTNIRIENNAA